MEFQDTIGIPPPMPPRRQLVKGWLTCMTFSAGWYVSRVWLTFTSQAKIYMELSWVMLTEVLQDVNVQNRFIDRCAFTFLVTPFFSKMVFEAFQNLTSSNHLCFLVLNPHETWFRQITCGSLDLADSTTIGHRWEAEASRSSRIFWRRCRPWVSTLMWCVGEVLLF